ncbi:MAG: hypothetical protein IJQ02_14555 [Oscillospiraceae bacterium]|nr:hypothetical protein [Oscillospiraceae bacterium]
MYSDARKVFTVFDSFLFHQGTDYSHRLAYSLRPRPFEPVIFEFPA